MSKRARFVILLTVIALCLWFLWPSITWYGRTPKEVQELALSSTEKIRDYSIAKASEEVLKIKDLAISNKDAKLDSEFAWLEKAAAKQYKKAGNKAPAEMTVSDILKAYPDELTFLEDIQGYYRNQILSAKRNYNKSVKLGLDLAGGMNVIISADLDSAVEANKDILKNAAEIAEFKKNAMQNTIDNLKTKIDRYGLAAPVVRQQGDDKIYIEIPGSAQSDAISSILTGKGVLNFRLSDMQATSAFNAYYNQNPASTFNAKGELTDPSIIPEDCEVLGEYTKDEYGLDKRTGFIVVKKEIALDGEHVKDVGVYAGDLGKINVTFKLDAEGTKQFGEFTSAHKGEYLAIVSDNKIKSNAQIQSAILEGSVQLSGAFSYEEASNIQKVLQSSWLTVPLTIESQAVLGSSIGDVQKIQGIKAICLGLVLILIFMLIFYKAAGINAVVAQILNLYIMFSILSALNLTVSLSSIAGMILTIGMAVDANVLVFERIKEELRAGKSRQAAISMGFSNALWAILDSNITTLIAAIFLAVLGNGTIQGFAISLAIGVLSSVFTALFVSRLIFDFDTDVLHAKKVSIGWGIKQ